jgi:hypothetical protein
MKLWQRLLTFTALTVLAVVHVQLVSTCGGDCAQEFQLIPILSPPMAAGVFVASIIFGTIILDTNFNMARYVGLFCVPCAMLYDMIIGTLFIECSGWLGGGLVIFGFCYFLLWITFYFLKGGVVEDHITSTDAPSDEKDQERLTESVQMAVSAAATMGAVFVV